MNAATGPAASTDITTSDGTVCTVNVNVVSGLWYRISGYFLASQITATGTPFVRLRLTGSSTGTIEYRFDNAGNTLSYAASAVVVGSISLPWQATATETIAFTLVARTSAGALRFAANSGQCWLEQLSPRA
jgi:hypothetical protein